MRFVILVRIRVFVCASLLLICQGLPALGQQSAATTASLNVPPLVKYSGVLTDVNGKPLTGVVGVTFFLYKDSEGGAPLWMETQNVQPNKSGHYSVMLGSTTSQGLPVDLFVSGEARWLGVQPQGQSEQPRVLLLSVPYALKAGDAETVGGLPPSAFVLATPQTVAGSAAANATIPGGAPPPAGTVTGSGTVNFVPLWTSTSNIGNSALFQSGTGSTAKMGINTTTPGSALDVNGSGTVRGLFSLPPTGMATATAGKNSQAQDLVASSFNSSTARAVNQTFQWQAEPAGNNTSSPSGTLNLLFGSGTSKPSETGLKISNTGIFTFASGQTFPGTGNGTITGVTAGTDLTGGGSSGSVTLNLDTTKVPQLAGGNSFSGNQSVNGNVSATQLVSNAAQGTAPLQVTSTTLVPNLNSGFLGGFSASAFQPAGSYATLAANTFAGTQTVSTGDVSVGSGDIDLPATTSATVGVLNLGGTPFLHACCSASANNIFIGPSTGNFTTTGTYNTAEGYGALFSNTTGGSNTATGSVALELNTTGSNNTADGNEALLSNTTGGFNTATGTGALLHNTTGSSNTALGDIALSANTTGSDNTAIGTVAGGASPNSALTTGNLDTYVGAFTSSGTQLNLTNATALGAYAEVTESNALVLGSINGVNGATANVNVGIGTTAPAYSLDVHGTGNFTGLITFASGQTFPGTGTISGVTAGTDLTGGGGSGNVTLNLDTTKVVTGVLAGTDLTGGGTGGVQTLNLDTTKVPQLNAANTFTGNQTVNGNLSATGVVTGSGFQIGSNLFAFGSFANANAFLGFAGNATTTGNLNTGIGVNALVNNTSGFQNTAVGVSALGSNTTGTDNTASGDGALVSNTTGSTNVGSGFEALAATTTGSNNTGIGSCALELNTTGSDNTALGLAAGYTPDLQKTTGSNNTFVGYFSVLGGPNETTLSNATAVGALAEVDQSNSLVLGSINGINSATADTNVGIGTTAPQTLFHIDHVPQPGVGTDLAEISSGGSVDVASLLLKNTGSGGFRLRVGAGTGSGYLASSGPMVFITNDTGTPSFPSPAAMTIDTSGNVSIKGNLSKGGGSFKIDHPLDPANKYLYHSFVESPDMMNVYNGNVVTNQRGLATVVLPEYFEALNRDFRYQLTVIGQFAQAIVAREIRGNRFTIRTDKPGVKVSWQVTGIRHDAYADAHRIQVEEEKAPQEQGRYLHPELFGASPEQAIGMRLPTTAATENASNRPMPCSR
jgi:hypothetical protein